jgi:hypothetical protein
LQIVDEAGHQRRLRPDHHEDRWLVRRQKAMTAAWSATSSATHSSPVRAMPALPGAQ